MLVSVELLIIKCNPCSAIEQKKVPQIYETYVQNKHSLRPMESGK